jgi:hypothetical protein
VGTKCFSDTSLTKKDCKDLEVIINKIMRYFVQNELDIAGMVTKEEEQATELREQLAAQAADEAGKVISDLGVSAEDLTNYKKNPFEDKILYNWTTVNNGDYNALVQNIGDDVIDQFNGNIWVLKVKVTEKKNNKVRWAYIGSKKLTNQEAMRDINNKRDQLKTYTGYTYQYTL